MTIIKRLPWRILLSAFWLVLLVYMIATQWKTVDLVGGSLRLATPAWLIVSLLSQLLLLFIFVLGLKKSLEINKVIISKSKIFTLLLQSIALNTVVPGGLAGSLLIAKNVTQAKKSFVPNLVVILTAQIIDFIFFWILVLVSTGKLIHLSSILFLSLLIGFMVIGYVLFIYFKLWVKLVEIFKNKLIRIVTHFGSLGQLTNLREIIIHTVKYFSLPGLLIYLFNLLIVYFVTLSFGIRLSPVAVLSLYTAISVVHVISPIPQGIGLVEGTFASVLALYGVSLDLALAIALTYRIITFWLPMLMGTYLYFNKKALIIIRHRFAVLGLVVLMFMVATINLLGSLEIPLHTHIQQLISFVPFKLIPYGRFASLVTGLVILLLIQGILRRKRSIFYLALLTAGASAVSHLVKGLNYTESGLSFILLGWLYLLKDQFTVDFDRSTLKSRLISLGLAMMFLITYGWLGIFRLSKYFEIDHSLLLSLKTLPSVIFGPRLAYGHFAHDFVNSLQLLSAFILLFIVWLLLKPVADELSGFSLKQNRARKIIQRYGDSSLAELCLYPDKFFWFSEKESVISYVLINRVAVALGDPIGPDNNCIYEWSKHCQKNDWIPAFYQTNSRNKKKYIDSNYCQFDIGHEALIDCLKFTLEGSTMKSIRNAVNKSQREGYRFEIVSTTLSGQTLNEMEGISSSWLSRMNGDEKRFSLGWFDRSFLKHNPVGLIYDKDDRIVAFTSLLPRYKAGGWAIDLIRYKENGNGIVELLLIGVIDWIGTQDMPTLSMGLSPLFQVGTRLDSTPEEKVAKQIFTHMKRGYNFSGLWAFKNRFNPRWEERYLWYLGRGNLPRVITAIVSANAGGSLMGYIPKPKFFNNK